MKKLTSVLLAAAAMTTVAFAEPATNATGFYLGANVGGANTNVKYDGSTKDTQTAATATNLQEQKADAGKMAWLFGAFAGYGMNVGQGAYLGGEIYGGFDSSKVTPYDQAYGTNLVVASSKATVKRTGFYGLALRAGYMVTPSTLAYIRLGLEAGKWKAEITPNAAAIDAAGGANAAESKKTFTKTKNTINFAPGLGFEMYLNKNLFLRAEYSYLFGPKLTVDQNTEGFNLGSTNMKHNFKVTQHAVKIGVGYKF